MFFALEAALDGLGIALMPSALVVDDIASGRLVIAWKVPGVYERAYYHLLSPLTRQPEIGKSFVEWLSMEGADFEPVRRVGHQGMRAAAPENRSPLFRIKSVAPYL